MSLYNSGSVDELVSRAEQAWPKLKRSPMNARSGECCRFTMLTYVKKNDFDRVAIWKARGRFPNRKVWDRLLCDRWQSVRCEIA